MIGFRCRGLVAASGPKHIGRKGLLLRGRWSRCLTSTKVPMCTIAAASAAFLR